MTACFNSSSPSSRRAITQFFSFVLMFSAASLLMMAAVRGQITPADLADLDPRLLGPDVLGERMVVPPSIPDWVFMECQSENSGEDKPTLINRVRQSICHRG